MLFQPVFLDQNDVEVLGKIWLIEASDKEEAFAKAKEHMAGLGVNVAYAVPSKNAFILTGVKEVKFLNEIAWL